MKIGSIVIEFNMNTHTDGYNEGFCFIIYLNYPLPAAPRVTSDFVETLQQHVPYITLNNIDF